MDIDMREDFREAVVSGDGDAVAELLSNGTDGNLRDGHGQTALMLAALHGQETVVRHLLAYGVDLNVTAKYGLSALMLAVVNRHAGVAKQLVDAGADLRIRGRGAPGFAGKSARDLARDAGLEDLADYIARAEGSRD